MVIYTEWVKINRIRRTLNSFIRLLAEIRPPLTLSIMGWQEGGDAYAKLRLASPLQAVEKLAQWILTAR